MIRVAAVGDVHVDQDVVGRYRPALDQLGDCADVLLLAGDLTRHGTVAEARCVATEFGGLAVPVIAVLGNHDYHSDQVPEVTGVLEDAGITVLEGAGTVVTLAGTRLGDVLVVAVNSDASVRRLKGEGRPVNPAEDRVAVLAALACVDHVIVFDEDSPRELIGLVRPDLYVKGGDYPPELIPEAELVRSLGGEVRSLEYLPDRSTSELIERIRSR